MSFVRMGEAGSDVYVYAGGDNYICQWCQLPGMSDFVTDSLPEMWRHLGAHLVAGHRVPAFVFEKLEDESAAQDKPQDGEADEDQGTRD